MTTLTPVEDNPFAAVAAAPKLTPVEGNPFQASSAPKLTPVEGNPFQTKDSRAPVMRGTVVPKDLADTGSTSVPAAPDPAVANKQPSFFDKAKTIAKTAIESNPIIGPSVVAAEGVKNIFDTINSPDTPEQAAIKQKITDAGKLPDNSSALGDLAIGMSSLGQGFIGNRLSNVQWQIDRLKQMNDPNTPTWRKALMYDASTMSDLPTLEKQKADLLKQFATEAKMPDVPQNPVYSAASISSPDAATTMKAAIQALKTSPYAYLRSSGIQNLPTSIPSIIGGVVGGVAAGKLGASAGAGVGSAAVEYGSDIQDGLQQFGADMKDEKSIQKVWDTHGPEIVRRAQNKAVVVGMLDAIGGGLTQKLAELPAHGLVQHAGQILGGMGVDAAAGMTGEAGGQMVNNGGKVTDWNSVLQEALGGIGPGAVQEGGQIVGHRVLQAYRGITGGGLPSEQELRDLWNSQNPKDPISTYKDAAAQGRTMYGFDDGSGVVTVSPDYHNAEAQAGIQGMDKGKLIAVHPDQVTGSMIGGKTAEQIASEVVAAPDRTELIEPYKKAGMSPSAIKQVFDAHTTLQSNGDTVAYQQKVQAIVDQFGTPVYQGSTQGLGITPREDNLIHTNGDFLPTTRPDGTVTYNDVGRTSQTSRAYNLDMFQHLTDAAKATVIPAPVTSRVNANQDFAKLIPQTFVFATPEAQQAFMTANEQQMKNLFLSGQVKWKGQLDARFLTPGVMGSVDRFTGFQVVDDKGETLGQQHIQNLLDASYHPHLGHMVASEIYSEARSRPYAADEIATRPYVQEILQVAEANPNKGVISYGFETRPGLAQWMEKLHGLAGMKGKILVVNAKQTSSYMLEVPLELKAQFPRLAEEIENQNAAGFRGYFINYTKDISLIVVNETTSGNDVGIVSTLAHEFGHAMVADRLSVASLATQIKIYGTYRRMKSAVTAMKRDPNTFHENVKDRVRTVEAQAPKGLNSQYDYYTSMEEFLAEQTARWALSHQIPYGLLGKFYASATHSIEVILKSVGKTNAIFQAEPEFNAWVASLRDGSVKAEYANAIEGRLTNKGIQLNSKWDEQATPMHEAAADTRSVLDHFLIKANPFNQEEKSAQQNAGVVKSVLDKYNWFYKWGANLRQLADANVHIKELQVIKELFNFAENTTNGIMVAADTTMQKWRQLGEVRGKALSAFLFDLNEMSYLPDAEFKKGVMRWPSEEEFIKLIQKHKLDKETIAVYKEVRDHFLGSLKRMHELQLRDASKISDLTLQQEAIAQVNKTMTQLVSKPYFPQMRFGSHTITIRNVATGEMTYFAMYENARQAKQALRELSKEVDQTTHNINPSIIPKEVMPFVGMSSWMLDKLRDMPGLTKEQLNWIDQLKFQAAPSMSFTKHMMKRKSYAGYSLDGRRTFANYMFHHARNYSRVLYGESFREAVNSLKHSIELVPGVVNTKKRVGMVDFVNHQINEWMNPSQDWAQIRGVVAQWHLGFNAKSAIVNATQIFITNAFLGSKFGGLRAEAALLKAGMQMSSFYRKGTYENMHESEFRAMDRAMKEGHIDQSMAAELAAMAIGGGMGARVGKSIVGDKFQKAYVSFAEKSMWMFRMTEQWQKRIAFRASWQLAINHPTTPWVVELSQRHPLQFAKMLGEGMSAEEARAYLAGVEAITSTLGVYNKQARPRYMQGRRSVLFAFQMFTQQNLWMLGNNPSMLPRYLLTMALIGGVQGFMPQDMWGILTALGRVAFGKQFELEREARKFVIDIMGENSPIPPDLIMHGAARYGFGLPALMNTLGARWVPNVDLSGSTSLNRLSPVDIGQIGKPGVQWSDLLAEQATSVAGAGYSIPLALGKALSASDMEVTDFKRWEGVMPAQLRNLSKAWRMASQGGITDKNRAVSLPFSTEDPEQVAEMIGIALGFTPTRVSQHYDRATAAREIDQYWQSQKQLLLRQAYFDLFVHEDDEAYQETLKKITRFNGEAIDKKYIITAQSIKDSFKNRMKAVNQVENTGGRETPGMTNVMDKMYPETTIITKTVK